MDADAPPAAGEADRAIRTGGSDGGGEDIGVVENPKGHLRALHRPALLVLHQHRQLFGVGVELEVIEEGGHTHFRDDLLPADLPEAAAVNEHRPAGRIGKPTLIQHLLRLAGPQEMPLSIAPDLHPRMVVVAVGPAWGVNLPGRDAHGPESVNAKGGLLAAAAIAGVVSPHGGDGAVIRGLVHHLFRIPIVDLDDGVMGGQVPHPVRQKAVEIVAAVAQLLLVDPDMQDVVEENILRQVLGKGGTLPQMHPVEGGGEKDTEIVVSQVAEGTVGIEPVDGGPDVLGNGGRIQTGLQLPGLDRTGLLQTGLEACQGGFCYVL